MKIKTIRKHDIFYLKENRYEKVKEIFKFVIRKIVKFKKIKKFKFNKFTLKSKLKKGDDVLRSWTATIDNKKVLTNGLNLIQPHNIIEIDLN